MLEGGSGNFIITSRNPEGTWSEPCWIAQGGIDPSLFWDDNGKAYFISTMPQSKKDGSEGNGIFQAEICPDTGELLTESRLISTGCGGRFAEGPHMFKKDGWYYLITAEGGTEFCHMECISRSQSVWGPFEPCPHNPILTAVRDHNPKFAGLGHMDIIEGNDGQWWGVFLGHRLTEAYYHHMGRETGIAPIHWADGWPVVNYGKTPGLEIEIPDCKHVNSDKNHTAIQDIYGNSQTRILFDGKPLGLEWNFMRSFFRDYSMTKHPGWMTLFGNEKTLSDRDTPAFIGRRIDNFDFRAETLMDFTPENQEEAGLAIAHTPWVHYEFVIVRKNKMIYPLVRKQIFDMVTETWGDPVDKGPVRLQIRGSRYKINFMIGISECDGMTLVGTGETKLLSSEVAGGCIGCYVGFYASGRGKRSINGAKYRWFEYEWLPPTPEKARYFDD